MNFSLLSRMFDLPIAVVDVETTGASTLYGDRVIEVGVARVEGGRVVGRYQQLIDPQRRVGPGITALTGITQAMVTGQPTFERQLPQLLDIMKDAAVMGHNVRFDLSFLQGEFRRAGTSLPEVFGQTPVLDTVRIARRRFGRGGNGLQVLSRRLGVVPETAHRALADALTTAQVFDKLIEPVGHWNLTLVDVLTHQGGPMPLVPEETRQGILPLELEEALELKRPVVMEYLDANQNRTERTIQPLQLRRYKGELLLVAHCHLRNDQRTFKVDRIVQLKRCEQT